MTVLHLTFSHTICGYKNSRIPYRGKIRRGKFSSGKNIRHLQNISSLFPDENFPQ